MPWQKGVTPPGSWAKEGVPPNPGGYSRKLRLATLLRRKLMQASEPGTEKTLAEELVESVIREGIRGNMEAVKLIFDRLEGKVQNGLPTPGNAARVLAEILGVSIEELPEPTVIDISAKHLPPKPPSDGEDFTVDNLPKPVIHSVQVQTT